MGGGERPGRVRALQEHSAKHSRRHHGVERPVRQQARHAAAGQHVHRLFHERGVHRPDDRGGRPEKRGPAASASPAWRAGAAPQRPGPWCRRPAATAWRPGFRCPRRAPRRPGRRPAPGRSSERRTRSAGLSSSCRMKARRPSAKISSSTRTGCTTASGPKYRASAWNPNVPTRKRAPRSQAGWRTRLTTVRQRGRAVVDCASTTASRCSTAPHALDRADRVAKKIAAAIRETLSSSLARTGRRWTTAPA